MILGVTPVRGGSVGIPRKNIKMVAGLPLVAWTIQAARGSKLLTRYIVSTEDDEIAAVSRQYGAEVLPRPVKLAAEEVLTLDVLQHVSQEIPSDIVVLLQATSPVRKPGLIDECIREFIEQGYDSLATGFISKSTGCGTKSLRRQDIPGVFCDDGNVYVIKTSLIKDGERWGKKIGRKIISRFENTEIDDDFDLWLAENILTKKGGF